MGIQLNQLMSLSNSSRGNGREGFSLLGNPESKPTTHGRQHLNPTMLRVGVARPGAIPG